MTEHTSNPFNNQEFRQEMSDLLDEKVGPLKATLIEHDRWINQQKGAGKVMHYTGTMLVAALTAIGEHWIFGGRR